jgi:hypothetical protein
MIIETVHGLRRTTWRAKLIRTDPGLVMAAGTVTSTNVQDATNQIAALSTTATTSGTLVNTNVQLSIDELIAAIVAADIPTIGTHDHDVLAQIAAAL